MLYVILVGVLVALDQWVKWLVLANIPLYERVSFLPPLVELTYVQNTGAAFSILSGRTEFLALVSLVLSVILGVAVAKKYFSRPFGRTSLAIVLAGAIGNLIDRALRGYVVDMFDFMFINFAVFNVADICVVLGGIASGIYYLFYYEKYDAPKKEEPQ